MREVLLSISFLDSVEFLAVSELIILLTLIYEGFVRPTIVHS